MYSPSPTSAGPANNFSCEAHEDKTDKTFFWIYFSSAMLAYAGSLALMLMLVRKTRAFYLRLQT